MMIPPAGAGPRVGMNPTTADEVNWQVGTLLRQFIDHAETVGHYQDWLVGVDLKVAPYNMTPELEGAIKSAVGDLNTALEAIDRTFINRLVGIW